MTDTTYPGDASLVNVWCREGSPPRPYKECSSNPFTVFVLTAHGGHCAHLPLGSWLTGKAWMDTVAMQFFSAVLAYSGESSSSPVSAFADDIEKAGAVLKSSYGHCSTSAV